jgi:hypothetical protein
LEPSLPGISIIVKVNWDAIRGWVLV